MPNFTLEDLQPHYKRYLGRDAGQADYDTHRGNVGGLEGVLGAIINSPEARDFSARQQAPATAPPPAAATPPPPATGSLGGGEGLTGRRGGFNSLLLDAPNQANRNQFRGFNDDRALSGGDPDSVKDLSRRFFGGQDFDLRGKSKDELDAWLTSLIPDARKAGLNILDVVGDQILVETKERGPEWVDIIQNAGGDDPAFQWLTQQEFGNTDDGGFAEPFGKLRGMAGGSDALRQLLMSGGLAGSSLMEQIQAALQRLLTGQPVTPPVVPPVPNIGGGGGGEGNPLEPLF